MTAITNTTPIAFRRPSLQLLALPKLGIGVAMAALSEAVGQAYGMAYVAPYQTIRQSPSVASDADLEGRNPNW